MKKTIYGLVLSGLLGLSSVASAQEAPQEKGAVERLGDGLGDLIGKGLDYVNRKIMEKSLEGEIAERFSYDLEDKRLDRFVGSRRYDVFESVDVTNFDDKKAVATLEYSFRSPDTSKYRNFTIFLQREFSLKDESIDEMVDEGKDWAVICGKKISEDEIDDILLLNMAIAERWDKKKSEYARDHQNHEFNYKIVFLTHGDSVYKERDTERNKAGMPEGRSQVGILVRVQDKFGNEVMEQRIVEEYSGSNRNWSFGRQLYLRDTSGFNFTEENYWQEKDFLAGLGESADKALRNGVSYIKSLFKD